jgi:hypothetical protein
MTKMKTNTDIFGGIFENLRKNNCSAILKIPRERFNALLLGELRHRKLLHSDNLSSDSLSAPHSPRNPAGGLGAFPPNPYVSLQLLATLCTWFDKDQIGSIENL